MTRITSKKRVRSTGETAGDEGAPGPDTHFSARSSDRLAPRKHPRQSRAKDTVAAILEAAAEVFAEKGYSGTTTNKIALRAGVSIGSLYQYYPGKDAILAGLRRRHLSDVQSVVERSLSELANVHVPFEQALRSLLRGLIDLHNKNPKLTRALSEDIVPPGLVAEAHGKREQELLTTEVEKMLRRRSDVRSGDLTVMAHVLVQTTEALTRWFAHDAPPTLDKEAFVDEALRLLTGYVRRAGLRPS